MPCPASLFPFRIPQNVIPTLGCDEVRVALHPSNASPEIPINAIGISMRMH
jgi:hypothetical protein